MLDIPYVSAPENACALACYTMVAQYFFPKTTFDEVAQIVGWDPGYIVWAFPFWLWMMDKGIKVRNHDLIALQQWADHGIEGLQNSVSAKEFQYYQQNTTDLAKVTKHIHKVLQHPHFIYQQQKPAFADLETALNLGAVCEVTLDSHTLDRIEGFELHRVVVLEVTETTVTFHDPRETPRPARQETREHFGKAWLESVSEPELCIYRA